MKKFMLLLFCVLASLSCGESSIVFKPTSTCILNKYCFFNAHVQFGLACTNFSSLDQLNSLSCTLSTEFIGQIPEIDLLFADNTILDSNIDTIFQLARVSMISNYTDRFQSITLINIDGIDLKFFEPLKTSRNVSNIFTKSTILRIYNSKFSLLNNKVNVLTSNECNRKTYQAMFSEKGENFLQAFDGLTFKQTKFNDKLCKLMFQNISLDTMELYYKYFRFWPSQEYMKLNSRIVRLSLYKISKLELDASFLDPDVFYRMKSLYIYHGSVFKIQTDLFKAPKFPYLRSIEFDNIINPRGLFHSSGGVAWMKHLNQNVDSIPFNANLSQKLIETYSKVFLTLYFEVIFYDTAGLYSTGFFPHVIYQFPIEDFCLFYDLPVDRLVFFQVSGQGVDLKNFSCTLKWLYRYENLYQLFGLVTPISTYGSPICNFTGLVEMCKIKPAVYKSDPYFDLFYVSQSFKSVKKILFTYIGPIFSAFGFVTNMLVVVTIGYNHKRRNEIRAQPKSNESILLDQPLYRYTLINSTLNAIYLLINILDYSITCRTTIVKKIFKILTIIESNNCFIQNVVMSILGNIIKIMSDTSLIQISLNRYVLVGKDHAEWLVKLSQIRIKVVFLSSFLASAIFSTVIYYQKNFLVYKTNNYKDEFYPNSAYYTPYYYNYFIGDGNSINGLEESLAQLPLITAFTLVHDIFTYFLFCIILFVLDVLTIIKLHNALKEKSKMLRDKAERNKCKESERRSIMMVILTSLVNIVFRAPELVSIVFYYVMTQNSVYIFRMLCSVYTTCSVFIDYAQVFYDISLCFYLFFYIKFNLVFQASYQVLVQAALRVVCRSKKQISLIK